MIIEIANFYSPKCSVYTVRKDRTSNSVNVIITASPFSNCQVFTLGNAICFINSLKINTLPEFIKKVKEVSKYAGIVKDNVLIDLNEDFFNNSFLNNSNKEVNPHEYVLKQRYKCKKGSPMILLMISLEE
jgi:hypothetical protein